MAKTLSALPKSLTGTDSPRWANAALAFTGLAGVAGLGVWLALKYDLPACLRIPTAAETDPPLIKRGTRYERYEIESGIVYPNIRTFYNAHAQAKQLPKDVPLLVFMHGLGGSIAQFEKLLASLSQVASCLAIDLPGCGLSDFEPQDVEAYTTTAFAELLFAAIDRYRDKDNNQKVILIGHSMGCSISALLTSPTSPLANLAQGVVLAMIAICPKASPPNDADLLKAQRLSNIPSTLFDMARMYDRRGGTDSVSVSRVIGEQADLETKKLQLRFNQQSKSRVFQNFLAAIVKQESEAKRTGAESLLGRRIWEAIEVPLFLVAAESDKLAPPHEVDQIVSWLTTQNRHHLSASSSTDMNGKLEITDAETSSKHDRALKVAVFPAPSSHGLLYTQSDVRILTNMIETFLSKYVTEHLSPSWQIKHLNASGKWEVKNLEKWKKVDPCSQPIANVFRAMKTMREIDETHNPKAFVQAYSYQYIPRGVAFVVDISFDTPVYKKDGLVQNGVDYIKLPMVSKCAPGQEEIERFIETIDGLRKHLPDEEATIGVHCHYGFNRTGFLIVCYLVERLGWKLHDAIEEFKEKRPPGIKHGYFVDDLEVRYSKIVRRGTLVG